MAGDLTSASYVHLATTSSEREALIAASQANRDRGRLISALENVEILRQQVQQIERSLAYPAIAPLGRIWRALRGVPQRARSPARFSHDSTSRGMALVIDDTWPQPDRDAGSVEIVRLVECLQRLRFQTILAAAKQHDGEQPARDALETRGIRCLRNSDASSVEAYIMAQGHTFDLCVLCRVFCGGVFLEQVEQHCLKSRVVFNSIDLNFLREERKAHLLNDDVLRAAVQQARLREEDVIRRCDATIVVSNTEAALLGTTQPECLVVQMPLARTLAPPVTPFERRHGIGFIGGFAHAPNRDGIGFFLSKIWPLIQRDLPGCELTIVGADAPAELLNGITGPVTLLGQVPDVGPWFESLRLTVAPLRFGARAKGKVASSLAAGVPCVVTPIAAEGMALDEAAGILAAITPAEFAAATVRVHEDAALWGRLSAGGLAYAAQQLSPPAWQEQLDGMLRRLGL